jgi:hypothetical protein
MNSHLSPKTSLALSLVMATALSANASPKLTSYWVDYNTLDIIVEIPERSLEILTAGDLYGRPGQGFVRLELPGCAQSAPPGSPSLPFVTAVIDAPLGAEMQISVDPGPYLESTSPAPVMPALAPAPKQPDFIPSFAVDPKIYSADVFYPENLGRLYDASVAGGLARGHRLVAVNLYPIQYNPASRTIRSYSRLTARVEFRHSGLTAASASIEKNYSPAWEEMIRRLCFAPSPDKNFPQKSADIFYDIFYGSSFQTAAQRLAHWKSRLGFKVRLTDAGGWTAQALRDSVRLRLPLATYVLLLSDPNAPGADSLPPSALSYTGGFRTDLYYSEIDGSGYLPDLFLGRLSVKNAAEAEAAVDKIISYEMGYFGAAGTDWLKKALFIAGYDPSFQWLGRSTNRYCHDILRRQGYSVVDTLVMASGEEQGRIVDRLNQGRAWAVYTAHGSPTAWSIGGSSNFTVDEVVSQVQNSGMPAMVSGHCCQSNNFMYSYSDCFGEVWPKLEGRGGLAYFGSVPLTYWDEDDWLQRRYFDVIYDSVPGLPGLGLLEPGRYTQYGLYWIDLNTSTSLKQYYFEAYHLLGDPSAAIWTGVPGSLIVSHSQVVTARTDSLAVFVRDSASGQPVAGALACIWSRANPARHRTGFTGSDGYIALPLDSMILGDTLLVTVAFQKRRPYLSQTLVMAKLNVLLSSRSIVVNVPTRITMRVTDPDSGDAPVCSLDIYASYNDAQPGQVGQTDADGRVVFTLNPSAGGYVALAGRRQGREMFRDTIRVLAPEGFRIARTYPNPSLGAVAVDFEVPRSSRVEIRAYNVAGQLVGTVYTGSLPTGYHRFTWNGCNQKGRRLSSGLYFLSLAVEGESRMSSKRIVLLR